MTDLRIHILKESRAARVEEVLYYQINIDNYQRAIEKVRSMTVEKQFLLRDFVTDLEKRLVSEELEQLKANVMLQVIDDQIKEAENVSTG